MSISGIVDNGCTRDPDECGESMVCEDLNGDYILGPGPSPCRWIYLFGDPTAVCVYWEPESDAGECLGEVELNTVELDVYQEGGNYLISVEFICTGLYSGVTTYMKFIRNYGTTKPDCRNLFREPIPLVEENGTLCDLTSVVCKVSAA